MRDRHSVFKLVLSLFCLSASAAYCWADAVANWPQFRGPGGNGVSEGKSLPDHWSVGEKPENIEWKTEIPGRGWSSPIVWGKKVFLTTAVSDGEIEAAKKGLYFGGERPAPSEKHHWKVICLDAESGKILWDKEVHEGIPPMSRHIKNSYASETPVTDGEHVYAYFGNVGLWCLDMNGNIVWNKDNEPKKTRYGWGTAASPILFQDRLYIVNDNDEDSYLLALDKKTGKEVWKQKREEKSNWSSPFAWTNDKRTEIVTAGSGQVRSYGLDGTVLWTLQGMSSITIGTPYAADGLLYLSSGYVGDKKHRPIFAIKPGATGDISLPQVEGAENPTSNDWIAWSKPLAGPYNPTTLVYGDRLYVLYDRGTISCYNAKDGTPLYEAQQIPDGKGFTCSPWAYDGKIFGLNEDGVTFVMKAGDKFELLNQNKLAGDDMGMATPAIAGDRLFIRTSARVYSIRNSSKK